MSRRNVSIVGISLLLAAGCTNVPGLLVAPEQGSAVVVGRIVVDATAQPITSAGRGCPDVRITVNGAPVSVEFDDACAFVINGIQPSELVVIRVELVELGVAGTVELARVLDGELIEIAVTPAARSLSVVVARRVLPDPSGRLPRVIEDNNVSILLPAGNYDQGLWVKGNNFTLVGEAGESCARPAGWTVITGDVLVEGNNATFRNIQFAGVVTIKANNPRFINCCFGDELLVFGNRGERGNRDDDRRGDDDDDDDDD